MSFNKDIKDDVWLSVVIPAYNGEHRIGDALNSIRAQDDSQVEVVVVDDGSTDSTLEIVKSYTDSLNVKVIERDHTGNWVSNTNYGILNSSGEYLCFLHQDDRWENGRLAIIREVFLHKPNVAMCFHPSWFIGPDGRRVGLWKSPFGGEGVEIVPPDVFLECLLVQNFIAIPSPVFKKDNAVRVGLLDDSLIYTADWDFWIRMSHLGPVAYIPKPLTYFTVHPESQTESLSNKANYVEEQLLSVLDRHLNSYKGSLKDKERLARVAHFSAQLNVALMKLNSRQTLQWIHLLKDFVGLGPKGWGHFFRCSRIIDRVLARLRVRLRHGAIETLLE